MFFKKSYQRLIVSLLMLAFLTAGSFVIAGCGLQKHNNNRKIFDQLNGRVITIAPDNNQWGR